MITVRDLLKVKGNQVWTIPSNTTVLKALETLAAKDVGALLVVDAGKIEGIISERDFVRSIAETGNCMIDSTVSEHMTRGVFSISPAQTIEECMQLMTDKRIRHLPVLDDGALVGLISIGDVVREIISNKQSMINSLEEYIGGRGYVQ